MSIKFRLYPTLSLRHMDALDFQIDYQAGYMKNPEDQTVLPLELKDHPQLEGVKELHDPLEEYDFKQHGLAVAVHCSFHNGSCLYGINGIAPSDSRIGLALQWYSKESDIRGTEILTDIPVNNDPVELNAGCVFDPGIYREKLDIVPILYIRKTCTPSAEESFLASRAGTIVGEFQDERLSVQFAGNGSIFPYTEAEKQPSDPLWEVQCSWNDPMTDLFDEHVQICVNTRHRDYPQVDPKSRKYNPALFAEMISHAMFVLFAKVRMSDTDWKVISGGSDFADGTIAQAVNYYYLTFGHEWNWDSLESIDNGLREYMNRSLKNEDLSNKPE